MERPELTENRVEKEPKSILFRLGGGANGDFKISLGGDSYHTVRHGDVYQDSSVYVKIEGGKPVISDVFKAGTKSSANELHDQAGLASALEKIRRFVEEGE